MSSRARRPYLMDKKSVTQFYQAPVRYLREIEARESEFEKPYVDDYYRPMHLDPPWPDWPPFPPIPPWPPLPPIEGPVPGLPGCAILCYEPSDCDDSIWCHPGIWCGTDIGCTLCTWVVEGATSGYTPHLSGVGSWGIDVWIDKDLVEEGGEALVRICMTDPCGNICCHDSEVQCKVCPPEIVISWDDVNSAETVAREGNAGVYVKDGLGPYTWSVAGTGFTMQHVTTDTVSNNVVADDTACGPATITVTDFCGDSTEGIVRCTTGTWSLGAPILQCTACGWDEPNNVCPGVGKDTCDPPEDYIEGKYQWRYDFPTGYEYWHANEYCPPTWHTYNCPGAALCPEQPPCGTPTQCGSGTPTADRTCYTLRFHKFEWTC